VQGAADVRRDVLATTGRGDEDNPALTGGDLGGNLGYHLGLGMGEGCAYRPFGKSRPREAFKGPIGSASWRFGLSHRLANTHRNPASRVSLHAGDV
jgi:hypothetical protein